MFGTRQNGSFFQSVSLRYHLMAYYFVTIECASVNTPVFVRKGIRFLHGFVKQKQGNVVTVLTEPSDKEKDVVILGPGTQHYIMVEDKVPAPKDIFLGTRVIAKHVKTGEYTFARVDTINGDKYSVTFEGRQGPKGVVAIESIRILDPPRFCGKPSCIPFFVGLS